MRQNILIGYTKVGRFNEYSIAGNYFYFQDVRTGNRLIRERSFEGIKF